MNFTSNDSQDTEPDQFNLARYNKEHQDKANSYDPLSYKYQFDNSTKYERRKQKKVMKKTSKAKKKRQQRDEEQEREAEFKQLTEDVVHYDSQEYVDHITQGDLPADEVQPAKIIVHTEIQWDNIRNVDGRDTMFI